MCVFVFKFKDLLLKKKSFFMEKSKIYSPLKRPFRVTQICLLSLSVVIIHKLIECQVWFYNNSHWTDFDEVFNAQENKQDCIIYLMSYWIFWSCYALYHNKPVKLKTKAPPKHRIENIMLCKQTHVMDKRPIYLAILAFVNIYSSCIIIQFSKIHNSSSKL